MIKVPDNDLENERALLSYIMNDGKSISSIASVIKADYFYDERHQYIYIAILELYKKGNEIDLITIKNQLGSLPMIGLDNKEDKFKREDVLAKIGGMTYLVGIIGELSYAIDTYIKILIESYKLRQIGRAIGLCQNNINNNLGSDEIIKLLEKSVKNIDAVQGNGESTSLGEALSERLLFLYDSLFDNKLSEKNITTGYSSIDTTLGSLSGGQLVTVGASSSIGKTMFGMNLANNNLTTGKKVVIFSLEMKKREILDLLLGMNMDINKKTLNDWTKKINDLNIKLGKLKDSIARGNTSEEDGINYKNTIDNEIEKIQMSKTEKLTYIEQHAGKLIDSDVYINDSSSQTPNGIRKELNRLSMSGDIDMVIVDHMGLMKSDIQGLNKTGETADVSRELKLIAGEYDCPVIMLTQLLSKEIDKRADKKPQVSDVKNSSSIFEDSNIMLLLNRPKYWDEYSTDNTMHINIAKNRGGITKTEYLNVDLTKQKLTELTERELEINRGNI